MNDIMPNGRPFHADPPGRPISVLIADDQALVRGGFRLILNAAGFDVVADAADGEQAVAEVLKHRPDVVLMDIRMPRLDGIEATRQILAAAGPVSAEPPARDDRTGSGGAGGPDSGPRIIILTTFDLDEYVYAALTAGASGFLLKDVTPEHLVSAVRLIRTGDALLAPSITRRLVERFALPAGGTPGVGVPGTPGTSARGASARGTGQATGAPGADSRPGHAAHQRPGIPGCDVSALTPRELEVLGLVARGMSNAEISAALTLSEATVKTHVAHILTKLGLRDRVQAVVAAYESGLVSPGTSAG